jgi:hypothetical protein
MTTAARRSTLLIPLVALLTATGCDGILWGRESPLLRDQLERAEQLWRQANIRHYSMIVTRGSPWALAHARVRVEVRDGAVVIAENADDGTPVPPELRARYPAVPGLFDIIRNALDRRVPGIFVGYDDEFGFPDIIRIDYDPGRTDDDLLIEVSGFAPSAIAG